jgi:hypothetical protein
MQSKPITTGVMVLNATFNNISVVLWQSVSLVEEIGVPVENHRPKLRDLKVVGFTTTHAIKAYHH